MTTSATSIALLRAQATAIVRRLKAGSGRRPGIDAVKFAVVQDDKLLSIIWTCEFIDDQPADALVAILVQEMAGGSVGTVQ